jgi:hypothetical protein
MISHARFGKLRLAQFRSDAEVAELKGCRPAQRWVPFPEGKRREAADPCRLVRQVKQFAG